MNKTFILKITENCNLNCAYCYANNNVKKKDMEIDEIIVVLKKLIEPHDKEIDIFLYGGEPSLSSVFLKNIHKIETAFQNLKINFALNTNLLDLNDIFLDFVLKKNVFLRVSVDGISKKHNSFRFGDSPLIGIFKKNFSFLRKKKDFVVDVAITSKNYSELYEIFSYFDKRKTKTKFYFASSLESKYIKSIVNEFSKIYNFLKSSNRDGEEFFAKKQGYVQCAYNDPYSFFISSDYKLTSCFSTFNKKEIIDLSDKKTNIEKIINAYGSEESISDERFYSSKKKCFDCEAFVICSSCGTKNEIINGDFYKVDDFTCSFYTKLYNALKKGKYKN